MILYAKHQRRRAPRVWALEKLLVFNRAAIAAYRLDQRDWAHLHFDPDNPRGVWIELLAEQTVAAMKIYRRPDGSQAMLYLSGYFAAHPRAAKIANASLSAEYLEPGWIWVCAPDQDQRIAALGGAEAIALAHRGIETAGQWMCVGCGHALADRPSQCPKCAGLSFEWVLTPLRAPAGLRAGRHNPKGGAR